MNEWRGGGCPRTPRQPGARRDDADSVHPALDEMEARTEATRAALLWEEGMKRCGIKKIEKRNER